MWTWEVLESIDCQHLFNGKQVLRCSVAQEGMVIKAAGFWWYVWQQEILKSGGKYILLVSRCGCAAVSGNMLSHAQQAVHAYPYSVLG